MRISKPTLRFAALLLATFPALGIAAQPTVNGLFHGDGDSALYNPYASSANGSVLYSYLHVPTSRLYVALVVGHAVNDIVCSPDKPYTSSAGWNPPRSCKRASDSEFATFSLECSPGSPNAWTWQQALGCPQINTAPQRDWVADSSCGPSSPAAAWPPGVEGNATSSFVANVNTYQDAVTPRAWNLYASGTAVDNWKSPFLASSPSNVTVVPGYPTYSGGSYQWEWSMVYEWSVDLGAAGADCGGQAIYFLAGNSHHSPGKTGAENDPLLPIPGDPILSDFGDLPTSYGTTRAAGGARHYVTVTGPYLGSALQAEADGVPTTDATGDGSEEDGVVAVIDGNWTPGSTRTLQVTVGNAPGGAVLAAWFDWNGDGDFNDAGEYVTWPVVNGTQSLALTVGAGFDWQNDDLYARFRIFSSAAAAPGGSLTQADSVGTATDGEVEDYFFEAGTLPVTLNAMDSAWEGGDLVVRWQTSSETDNVGFQVWGRIHNEWRPLGDLVASHGMSSGLPQDYEVRLSPPDGLSGLQLVDHDTRGRQGRFGEFRIGEAYGERQEIRPLDWSGPRAEREERLRDRGFTDTALAGPERIAATMGAASSAPSSSAAPAGRWKKLHRAASRPSAGEPDRLALPVTGNRVAGGEEIEVTLGPQTHLAVTHAGIQRVRYEELRDGGLDLAGVHAQDVAVTFRGQPVERWIDGPQKLGPGSVLEFVGQPPSGDDALYLDANLYQVSVDRDRAVAPRTLGVARVKGPSPAYLREVRSDRPLLYRHQSPTGDPWVESSLLVQRGRTVEVTLDLVVEGPVLEGPARLVLGLGTLTDLPDQRDADGALLPEHNVEVSFRGPGGDFAPLAHSSVSGQRDWRLETELPDGLLAAGLHQVQLRFTTDYPYSLVTVDDYAVLHPAPYRGPCLDFAADRGTGGYRIEGFTGPAVSAWAESAGGAFTRLTPRLVELPGGGFAAELRPLQAARFWVTEEPHHPAVFTTEAPAADLLAGAAELVVLAAPGFVGTRALDDYLAQHADLDPVVVDVEDVYNAVGHGMALPSAITDYLRARQAVHPFTHVQLVGSDCYDRRNYISACIAFLPLPTAPVGSNRFTPSQNRLVDLDGDGVGDKAVGQFSVRSEAELERVVAKAVAWETSGLWAADTALFVAEEGDGLHDFPAQVERLRKRLGWAGAEVLDLTAHPKIATARTALSAALGAGRTLTVFSGHSSPAVWSYRSLLTSASAASLPNAGRPSLMVPLACETTWDVSPNANVLGHQLLYGGDGGALAISGAAALSSLEENERMANHVLDGLDAGRTLGEAVLAGRRALGPAFQELQDNWLTQGDVALELGR